MNQSEEVLEPTVKGINLKKPIERGSLLTEEVPILKHENVPRTGLSLSTLSPSNGIYDRLYICFIEDDESNNIKVVLRCRQPNSKEKDAGIQKIISTDNEINEVMIQYKATTRSYKYDKVLGQFATQADVFNNSAVSIVNDVLNGYTGTIYAFGPYGTGKTHTLEGVLDDQVNKGIIPRSFHMIFDSLNRRGAEYTVKMSYIEIVAEVVNDLLKDGNVVKVQDDPEKGVIMNGITEQDIPDEETALMYYKDASKRKQSTTNPALAGKTTGILIISIYSKEKTADGETCSRVGKLNFCDCADSDLLTRRRHQRARDEKNIARSLVTLGSVITALADKAKRIPYRDSKLTRILQESLGGNSKTCVIATISPSQLSLEQTVTALEYAFRAKSIKNHPTVYQKVTMTAMILDYAKKINDLHKMISSQIGKEGTTIEKNEYDKIKNDIDSKTKSLLEVQSQFESLKLSETMSQNKLDYYTEEYKTSSAHLDNHLTNDKEFNKTTGVLKCSLYAAIEDQVDYRQKIDSGLSTEETNASSKDRYSKEFQSKLNYLNTSLQDYRNYHSQQVEEIKTSIIQFIENHSETLVSTSSDVKSLISQLSETITTLDSEVVSLTERIQGKIDKANEDLKNWKGVVDSTLAEQQKDIAASHDKFKTVLSTVDGELLKFTNSLLKQFADKRTEFQSKLDEQKEQIQTQMTTFQDSLLTQISQFQSAQKQSLNDIINQRVTTSCKTREDLDQFSGLYKAEIRKIYYEATNYFTIVGNCLEQRRSLMTNHNTNSTATNVEITNQIEAMRDRTAKYIEDNDNLRKQARSIQSVIKSCVKDLNTWSILKTYPEQCTEFNKYQLDLFGRISGLYDITKDYLSKYEACLRNVDPMKEYDIPTQFTICEICAKEKGEYEDDNDDEEDEDENDNENEPKVLPIKTQMSQRLLTPTSSGTTTKPLSSSSTTTTTTISSSKPKTTSSSSSSSSSKKSEKVEKVEKHEKKSKPAKEEPPPPPPPAPKAEEEDPFASAGGDAFAEFGEDPFA